MSDAANARSLREALEEALMANPDDRAAHMAYADHLQEQSDPHFAARGEFIQVQLALQDPKTSPEAHKRLRQREVELLRKHFAAWRDDRSPFMLERAPREDVIGEVLCAADSGARYHFVRGWVDRAEVSHLHGALARAMRANPLLLLLRHLEVEATNYWDPGYDDLAAAPYLRGVRTFRLGRAPDSSVAAQGDQVARLVARMTNVEEVRLFAHAMPTTELFSLHLPRLRVLQADNLSDYDLHVLAGNPSLGELRHLSFTPAWTDAPEDERPFQLPQVRALVRSRHLGSLTHLTLRRSGMEDAGCAEIVRSGILKRLRELDLWGGCITDRGARLLANCPDLRNLELLSIGGNHLSEDGLTALRDTGVPLMTERPPGVGEGDDEDDVYEDDME
jgi:uncharacterized protein (TIGR02996 family)